MSDPRYRDFRAGFFHFRRHYVIFKDCLADKGQEEIRQMFKSATPHNKDIIVNAIKANCVVRRKDFNETLATSYPFIKYESTLVEFKNPNNGITVKREVRKYV